MNDQSRLLEQLRIDRGAAAPVEAAGRRSWLWILLTLLVAAAVAAVFLWRGGLERATPVQAVSAQPIGPRGPAASASVLDASGYVVARRQATVSSKLTGKVTELRFEEGQQVREGEVLAVLDASNVRAELALADAQLSAARAALDELRVQRAEAQRQLDRTRALVDDNLVSRAELDAAEASVDTLDAQLQRVCQEVVVAERRLDVTRQTLEDNTVRAPFDGIVTVKNAQVGEMISPLATGGAGTRTGIGTIVDMESLEIEVDVNESFINRVEPGQRVSAKLNAYPDWQVPAHVIAVIPTADRSKATVAVRIGFDESDPRILPEMGVRVSFLDSAPATQEVAEDAQPDGVLVPQAAVQDGAVYLLRDGQVERRAVSLGATRGDAVIVTAGLRAGERVAISDTPLADGEAVRIAGR